jgi:hypothetical protein
MSNIFLAPLRNRTNLFTLLVVVSIFTIFRLSGGTIEAALNSPLINRGASYSGKVETSNTRQFQYGNNSLNLNSLDASKSAVRGNDRVIDKKKEVREDSLKSRDSDSHFAEIERALGMR